MNKIGVINTFPAEGSRNIGDYLISKSSQCAISDICPKCEIVSFFRADMWEEIQRNGFSIFSALKHQIEQINSENITFLKRHLIGSRMNENP